MKYTVIQPPFTLNFREMPKSELKAYFQWFQGILFERISELENAVRNTQGFETWQAGFTPELLDALGEWFAEHVEVRLRTKEEIIEIQQKSSYTIPIPEEELTNRTFSLAMDIGMYLSQVLLKADARLKWGQNFGSKKNANYGQPVLVGFGVMAFNPVRIAVTLAYGIASKEKSGERLSELYHIWLNMIK